MKRAAVSILAAILTLTSMQFAQAGAQGGPKEATFRMRPYGITRMRQTFDEYVSAQVRVNGERNANLKAKVYDENGTMVDVDSGNPLVLWWTPEKTQVFSIYLYSKVGKSVLVRVRTN